MSARGSGLLATTTSLVLCTIGAGILSFPYAALQSGIALLVPSTIVFSLLAAYMDLTQPNLRASCNIDLVSAIALNLVA